MIWGGSAHLSIDLVLAQKFDQKKVLQLALAIATGAEELQANLGASSSSSRRIRAGARRSFGGSKAQNERF
jgi:hypothetical protein